MNNPPRAAKAKAWQGLGRLAAQPGFWPGSLLHFRICSLCTTLILGANTLYFHSRAFSSHKAQIHTACLQKGFCKPFHALDFSKWDYIYICMSTTDLEGYTSVWSWWRRIYSNQGATLLNCWEFQFASLKYNV